MECIWFPFPTNEFAVSHTTGRPAIATMSENSRFLHPSYSVHRTEYTASSLPKWQLQRTIPETRIRPGGASMITAPRPVLKPLFLFFWSLLLHLLLYLCIEHSHSNHAVAKDHHRYRSGKCTPTMHSESNYISPPSHFTPRSKTLITTIQQGIDDILAILLALSAKPEELEIQLISLTFGNIEVRR